jgi:hypothetical protein
MWVANASQNLFCTVPNSAKFLALIDLIKTIDCFRTVANYGSYFMSQCVPNADTGSGYDRRQLCALLYRLDEIKA